MRISDQIGMSEKVCKKYFWKRGYRVVRGGIFIGVCLVHHMDSFKRLSAERKFYYLILATQIYRTSLLEIGVGRPNDKTLFKKEYNLFLYREICRAQKAIFYLKDSHLNALSILAKNWPHSIPFSGVPDYFVYKSFIRRLGNNRWCKYTPPKDRKKEMDYFFVEAKRINESMSKNQKSIAGRLQFKTNIPVFIFQLTRNSYLLRKYNPILMK